LIPYEECKYLLLIDTPLKKAKKARQASAAGGYNINTGLEAGSHAGFISLDISHPALAAVGRE